MEKCKGPPKMRLKTGPETKRKIVGKKGTQGAQGSAVLLDGMKLGGGGPYTNPAGLTSPGGQSQTLGTLHWCTRHGGG